MNLNDIIDYQLGLCDSILAIEFKNIASKEFISIVKELSRRLQEYENNEERRAIIQKSFRVYLAVKQA